MQEYLKALLAAYLLAFSYATARPQDPQVNQEAPSSITTIGDLISSPLATPTATTIGDSSSSLAAGSNTAIASIPQSTGTTYTIYNASLTYYGGQPPSTHFQLVCSGAEPGAAPVSCNGQWTTEDSNKANHLTCTNANVDVAVVILVAGGMDVHITLKQVFSTHAFPLCLESSDDFLPLLTLSLSLPGPTSCIELQANCNSLAGSHQNEQVWHNSAGLDDIG